MVEKYRSTELAKIIKKAGGVTALSKHLNTSPVNLYDFIKRGDIAPKYAPLIEEYTKGDVRCEDLNRDVDWAIVRETARQDFLLKLIEVVTSNELIDEVKPE